MSVVLVSGGGGRRAAGVRSTRAAAAVMVVAVGIVTSVDTALPVGVSQGVARPRLVVAATTAVEQAHAGRAQTAPATLLFAPLMVTTSAAVGTVTTTDTALPVGRRKTRTAGIVVTVDTARPVTHGNTIPVGVVTTTDSALPVSQAGLIRHNLCPNPAAGVTVTGWAGADTPAQATGLSGFPVTTGVTWTAGTFQTTPTAAASAGTTYTLSVYVRQNTGFAQNNRTLYLGFTRSAGGDDFSNTVTVSLADNTVTRIDITATAPANTTGAYLLLDGINAGLSGGVTMTACLAEEASALGTYFDGDTAGADWDGTPGLSTSTFGVTAGLELDAAPAGTLPAGSPVTFTQALSLTAAAAGTVPAGAAVTFTGVSHSGHRRRPGILVATTIRGPQLVPA